MKNRIFIGSLSVVFFTCMLFVAIPIMAQEPIKKTQLTLRGFNAPDAEDALDDDSPQSPQQKIKEPEQDNTPRSLQQEVKKPEQENPPRSPQRAEVKLTSSTQYLWYQDLLAVDREKSIQDFAQYLRVNVTNLDKEGKINFYAYGRAIKELWTDHDEDFQGRLYYFYLDYRDAFNEHLDLRAGRTFVNEAAVSGTIDGIHMDLKNLGPMGITFFGGRNVIFADKTETGTRGDGLIGMSVYLDTIKNTHVEVSYGRKYGEADGDSLVARENVGLDFSTTPISGMVNFYGRLKYDTISESFNEMLFGAKVTPLQDKTLRGEYYESYPTFDTSSIYSVFAVDQYKEQSISAEYQLTSNYRVSVKYAREDFSGNIGNSDSAIANVYDVGFLAHPIKNLTINATYEERSGYTDGLSGIRLYGEYKIPKMVLMAGMDYDDFRRYDSRDGNAEKYWAGVNYEFSKIITASVKVEDDINFNYNNSYKGFAAININY